MKSAKIKPAVNQVRFLLSVELFDSFSLYFQISFHPYNYAEHKALLEYCANHAIVIEAFSSLAYV